MEPTGVRLPAIVLSASVTVEARERASAAGADEFIGKPFDAAALLQTIDRLARRKFRTPASLVSSPPLSSPDGATLVNQVRMAELENIARDPAFLAELLRGFRIDVEAIFARLDAPVASGHWGAVRDLMHALKGAAVGIGAQQLGVLCEEFDAAVASGQTGQLADKRAGMRRCFDATLAQLNSYTERKHQVSL
jgi:HPt (histidine-containing phosphotransfer) domain-containing protein